MALMEGRKASLQFEEAGRADAGPCPGLRQKAGRSSGDCVRAAWVIRMA